MEEDRRRSGRWSRGGGGGGGVGAAPVGYDLVESSGAKDGIVEEDSEEEPKPQLPRPPSPEMTVHLIPVLTLFCFLVLFLISHDPSAKDLGEFGGSTALLHNRDTDAIATAGLRSLAVGAESTMSGGVTEAAAAARGHRRLKELEKEKLRSVGGGGGGGVRSRKLGVGGAGFEERLRRAS